jgi:hypothetical protein
MEILAVMQQRLRLSASVNLFSIRLFLLDEFILLFMIPLLFNV